MFKTTKRDETMSLCRIRTTSAMILGLLCCVMTSFSAAQTQNSRLLTANTYLERGKDWFAKQELNKAIADFDLAIASAPDFGVAYYNRGTAKCLKGDLDGALRDFDRALQLNPRHIEAYLNRGHVKYKKGDLAGAISDNSKAIELNPRLAEAWNNRG